MEKTKPNRKSKTLLRSVVINMIIAVVVVLGIEAYREWKNYERTARYNSTYYVEDVYALAVAWDSGFSDVNESPIDMQAMADDLKLIPPRNPYRRDHKTIITTIDKRIPGAVYYVPGPLEDPSLFACGHFYGRRDQTIDFMTEGDDPWVIGWALSKRDGIADGVASAASFGSGLGDLMPLSNPSRLWKRIWKDGFYWKYSDGTKVDPYDERFLAMFRDYRKRHPENFAAEKRPRMPKGFTFSKEETERSGRYESVREYYKKLYGYDPVVGDEKVKE
jgi:hypothetical protein